MLNRSGTHFYRDYRSIIMLLVYSVKGWGLWVGRGFVFFFWCIEPPNVFNMSQGKAEFPGSYWRWHADSFMLRVSTNSLRDYAFGPRNVTSGCVSPKVSDVSTGTNRRVSVGRVRVGYQRRSWLLFLSFFFFLRNKKKFEWKWKFSTCSPVTISSVTENKGAEEREVWSEVSRYDMCIILPSVCCRGKRHQRELNRFTCGTAAGECTFKAPFLCMLAYLSW